MITYNPKDWFRLIFQFHQTDTFRVLLPTMAFLGLVTAVLVYLERNHGLLLESSTVFHQILGFVLSMLLVFRINTAYERWWEGRRLWGALVNVSRGLAVKLSAALSKEYKEELFVVLDALRLFPHVLRDHLRGNQSLRYPVPADSRLANGLSTSQHQPLFLYDFIVRQLESLRVRGALSTETLLYLNPELTSLIDVTGACERIKSSPIPFSYSLFLKKTIFVYAVTMPFPFSVAFGYWAVPAVPLILYVFASIELVSEEVEEPFGLDENDLPLDEIVEKIASNIDALRKNALTGEASVQQ